MGYKDAKHRTTNVVNIDMSGGLNYAQSAKNIAENELRVARNLLYDPQTGKPVTRQGTRCCTGTALSYPILRMHYYEKSATLKWLVCASGGKLYYVVPGDVGYLVTESGDTLTDESGNPLYTETVTWTEIGALTDDDTTPSFLTYNSLLLIADGGENIRTWDGTTYTTLSDGLYATALCAIKGRVVANSAADLDLVTLSGEEDQTDWDTSSGDAVGLRAGFGDLLAVNAFSVFGEDLIISKKGDVRKTLYRLNVADATTTNWYIQQLSDHNAAQNHMSMISAFNNVFFVDTNGFKSLRGVTEYGDLEVDVTGSRINTIFADAPTCYDMAYIPAYSAIWFCLGSRVWSCHRITASDGTIRYPFTDMIFGQGIIRCCVQVGELIYLAGHNGYLYYMSSHVATDETAPSTTAAYSSKLQTKSFSVLGDLVVRRMKVDMVPKVSGAGSIAANKTNLQSFTISTAGTLLHDATGYLAAATGYLYDDSAAPWSENVRNRYRDDEISFSVNTTSGRVEIENIAVDMAMVEGQ
jgi:hypothetical protein